MDAEIANWRKAERKRLIATRLAIGSDVRQEHTRQIASQLDALVTTSRDVCLSAYWPFRGEPNLIPWISTLADRGVRVALPVVIEKGKPLEFREWQPGAKLAKGVWNIPYPSDGAPVTPTVVIAPLVGFDQAGFRLGYGGGFFDRTLAALSRKPLAIGVGYPALEISTIHPLSHDIPMNWIVTGSGAPRQTRHSDNPHSSAR